MSQFYALVEVRKQTHLAAVKSLEQQADRFLLLSALLAAERALHPAMSLKKLYLKLKPGFVGRDAFVAFGMENGFEPAVKAKFHKTTHSASAGARPNLLHDLVICTLNRVWVSDITYFKIGDTWFYIVLIIDLYSRKILGWNVSDRMFAEANLKALEMALRTRGVENFDNKLIHHSDKGSQYRSRAYTDKLKEHGLLISMGNCCYDNAHMESANGILKTEYLNHRPIKNQNDLVHFMKQDVWLYNSERPHGSLNMMTPDEFERYILNINLHQRTRLPVYSDKNRKNNLLVTNPDSQQLRLQFTGVL